MTIQQFEQALGSQLNAIFVYGSLVQGHYQPEESDINLLVVVTDDTDLIALRQIYQPVWEAHRESLKRAPLLATRQAFTRYLRLNPAFGYRLSREAKPLYGEPDLIADHLPPLNPHEFYAYLVTEALQASAALAPNLLESEAALLAEKHLRRFARRIRNEQLPEKETAAQQIARIHHYINPIITRLPDVQKWAQAKSKGATSPFLPGLRSIYNETGKTVLVFSRLDPQQIIAIDWQKLAQRVPNNNKGLQVTSVEQLCLSIMYDRPLDHQFQRYQHSWGVDFVPALKPAPRQMLRHAGRVPSEILINSLPNAYLAKSDGSDKSLHKIIHDFQNLMLNVQLEHELLHRFKLVETRFKPPSPIPDRETPPLQRIQALFQHLEWWSDYYANEMIKHEP